MQICGSCLSNARPDGAMRIASVENLHDSRGAVLDGQVISMQLVRIALSYEARIPYLFPDAPCIACGGPPDIILPET